MKSDFKTVKNFVKTLEMTLMIDTNLVVRVGFPHIFVIVIWYMFDITKYFVLVL